MNKWINVKDMLPLRDLYLHKQKFPKENHIVVLVAVCNTTEPILAYFDGEKFFDRFQEIHGVMYWSPTLPVPSDCFD